MPLYRCQVRLAYNNAAGIAYKWSHLWYVVADTLDAAAVTVENMREPYRAMLDANAFVYEMYITDNQPETSTFLTKQFAAPQRGTLAAHTTAQLLPRFNVVRVDLNVANSRPSRKFHRVPLGSGNMNGGELGSNISNTIATQFNIIRQLTNVVDESGNVFIGVTVKGVTSRRVGRYAEVAVPARPTT